MKRSNILISEKDKLIIICNKKTGFTSLNRFLPEERFSREIRLAKQLKKKNISQYKKILIKRDPYSRIKSFYFDWLVDKDKHFTFSKQKQLNVHYQHLEFVMSDQEFSRFMAFRNKKNPERFLLFMQHLSHLYMLNDHTHPQSYLYQSAGLTIQDFDEVIDIKQMSDVLANIINIEIGCSNKSSHSINPEIFNSRLVH